jgi:hypothetical protein
VELYDLEVDPFEQDNLAGMPYVRETEQHLESQLRTWMEQTGDPVLLGPVPSPSWRQARAMFKNLE